MIWCLKLIVIGHYNRQALTHGSFMGDAYENFCNEMKGVSIDEIAGAEILKVKEAYLDD